MINHVYIHTPYCVKKCGYCSFYSESLQYTTVDRYLKFDYEPINNYLDIVCGEIDYYKSIYDITPETIYFGGGTPSLLSSRDIENILYKFNLSKISEITIEANPATVNTSQIKSYRELGINRLSLGVQSMIDSELSLLGRLHKTSDIISLYDNELREIFKNISLDLIYGLPNQKLADVEYSINQMMKLKPEHISIYNLSLDENVPLYDKISELPSDETVADMYTLITDTLIKNDYIHYELSSFYKRGATPSLHNLSYWSGEYYLGLGAGACGFSHNKDGQNFRYINNKLLSYKNNDYLQEKTILSNSDFETEFIFTGLRKTQGINIIDFDRRFNTSILSKYDSVINKLVEKGMIEIDENIKINKDYYFVSNEILCEFV